ncbi:hypothetical protein LIP_1458 [Limnochorda pilosa]|uniref:Uncharacterized protein n=1 Tax=Limnochorda pilosa TaxID=1555112 RepID=A0A0K2SJX2_LIMPI|nr:hypothetical protein LIP_1458 [Limnochorda pilosa]
MGEPELPVADRLLASCTRRDPSHSHAAWGRNLVYYSVRSHALAGEPYAYRWRDMAQPSRHT